MDELQEEYQTGKRGRRGEVGGTLYQAENLQLLSSSFSESGRGVGVEGSLLSGGERERIGEGEQNEEKEEEMDRERGGRIGGAYQVRKEQAEVVEEKYQEEEEVEEEENEEEQEVREGGGR